MIALIQRVSYAKVFLFSELYSEIGEGLLVLVGVEKKDSIVNAERIVDKLLAYRIFGDALGKMNLSVKDKKGDVMLVSQFTLAADTNKGLRPSFSSAKPPREAEKIFKHLVNFAKQEYSKINTGKFGADMQIRLENNGPVTFYLKS
jgi:D-tyrosyl-tRNA(Tyr) deacylase